MAEGAMSDPAKMTAATKTITTFNSLWEDLRKAVFGRMDLPFMELYDFGGQPAHFL